MSATFPPATAVWAGPQPQRLVCLLLLHPLLLLLFCLEHQLRNRSKHLQRAANSISTPNAANIVSDTRFVQIYRNIFIQPQTDVVEFNATRSFFQIAENFRLSARFCSNIQFCPKFLGDFQAKILYFWKKIFREAKIYGAISNSSPPTAMPQQTWVIWKTSNLLKHKDICQCGKIKYKAWVKFATHKNKTCSMSMQQITQQNTVNTPR